MSSVEFESIPRPRSDEPFWSKMPPAPTVACLTLDDRVIALVLDPKNDNKSVFCANLRADQKNDFIAALKDPDTVVELLGALVKDDGASTANPSPDATPSPDADAKTIVITDTGGDGPGPKLVYKLTLKTA